MGQKKRAAESDSLVSKCRNDHSEEVLEEESFAGGMSVHWAEFYADSGRCQEGVEGVMFQVSSVRRGRGLGGRGRFLLRRRRVKIRWGGAVI